MIRRAADAGLSTLVITVDVPVSSNRERNRRNGFVRPLKLTLKTKLEACLHPAWMVEFLRLRPADAVQLAGAMRRAGASAPG